MSTPLVVYRWAIVDCETRLTEERIRWQNGGEIAKPLLFLTRKDARSAVALHNAIADRWGWRQRAARVRVTIEETK